MKVADNRFMVKRFALIFLFSTLFSLFSSPRLPPVFKQNLYAENKENRTEPSLSFLVGSDKGLYTVNDRNEASLLWGGGKVEQILYVRFPKSKWYFRTSRGILYTEDLKTFEERNAGLPFLQIKTYEREEIGFEKRIHALKDLAINPMNGEELVTATKDAVYISENGGKSWRSIGSTSRKTAGIKAAAIGTFSGERVVFMSHSIYGFSYYRLDGEKRWRDAGAGFSIFPSITSVDEISDIYIRQNDAGECEVYAANTFLPRIYRFDWQTKRAVCIYKGKENAGFTDSLTSVGNVLTAVRLGGLLSLDTLTFTSPGKPEKFDEWKKSFLASPGTPLCAFIPHDRSALGEALVLSELWALYPSDIGSPYAQKANAKRSVYASAYQCRTQAGVNKFIRIAKQNNLNSLVIDMKDDYGLLRYKSTDEKVLSTARSSAYALDLDYFVGECKKSDIYLIARIVVFKDRHLAKQNEGSFAVWDKKTSRAWQGIKRYENLEDADGAKRTRALYYDEFWVDPYCPYVWKYNVDIARELIKRGFDEIQFDYIRFPTDGLNLANASFRYKSEGMDKEAALMSFLNYARKNIDAPIGVDIYGANGWYRSGTRTGQDVEMLSNFVDVICPMFYPSHFENSFLNYKPYALRPKRIYYFGTFRNTIIARNRVIVRPWVQAFYLNVKYDRQYYDKAYVKGEVEGVNESVKRGYMYWNNVGNYEMISPDNCEEKNSAGGNTEPTLFSVIDY